MCKAFNTKQEINKEVTKMAKLKMWKCDVARQNKIRNKHTWRNLKLIENHENKREMIEAI